MSGDADGSKAGRARPGRKRPRQESWRRTNARYVGRARHLFGVLRQLADLRRNDAELAAMNHKKRGRPYKYTHSMVAAISFLRDRLQLDFRGCEGMAAAFADGGGPEFTTIFRRISSQDAPIGGSLSGVTCEDVAIDLVPDGTGMTPAVRSEYLRVTHRLKRGFFRLTIMINKKTLEIVAFELTDDSVGEPTVFRPLLENALANMGVDPDGRRKAVSGQKNSRGRTYAAITLMADGGYDSREIFSECRRLGIRTRIRVRKNANCRADGTDRARAEAVLEQLGGGSGVTAEEYAAMDEAERERNRKEWKKLVGYGTRWLVEIVISAFKRTYGGSVMARKLGYIRQEIRLKIRTYNTMLRVGREAAAEA